MQDPSLILTLASTGTMGIGIACLAALKGWQGWLELKKLEAEKRPGAARPFPPARADIAELKERVRRLEAIANGIDC